MKNFSIIKIMIVLCLSALWLYPYDYRTEHIVLVPCFLAMVMFLLLLRNKYLALMPVIAASVGISVYSETFLICFLPALVWIALYRTLRYENTNRSAGNDGLFLTLSVFYFGVTVFALSRAWTPNRQPFVFYVKYSLLLVESLFFLFFALFPVYGDKKKSKTVLQIIRKTRIAFVSGILQFVVVFLFCVRYGDYVSLYLLSSFICFCVVLLTENPIFEKNKE